MKQQTKDYIESICKEDLSIVSNMYKAQMMLRNFKSFRDCDTTENVPFSLLEKHLKRFVSKYDVSIGQIMAITDITGEMSWHGGMFSNEKNEYGRSTWMFTVHANDIYSYIVKIVLMSFVYVKDGKIPLRDPNKKLDKMRR